MTTIDQSNAATKNEVASVVSEKGLIVVTTAAGTQRYECTADGTSDDRSTIVSALSYAASNMPARVDFGPGDYGIFGGYVMTPAQGSRGLTIAGCPGATRLRFTSGVALTGSQEIAIKIQPSVTPTVGVYADYLHDITVIGMGFYDDDPSTHGGGGASDESHGVRIDYCVNAVIENCFALDIGDEGFDLSRVKGGAIRNCYAENTPSQGSNGAPVSVQQGCTNVVVEGCKLFGSNTIGTKGAATDSSGVSIATIAATAIDGVVVKGNVIRDFDNGVFINTSAARIDRVNVIGNEMDNVAAGVLRSGASHVAQYIKVIGNTVSDCTDTAFDFAVSAANTQDVFICDNIVDNPTTRGMLLLVTRATLSNNHFSQCPQAIVCTGGDDITISGGMMYQCGGAGAQVVDFTSTDNVSMSSVSLLDVQSTTSIILGVQDVKNCVIKRNEGSQVDSTVITQAGAGINNCVNAVGNTLVNCGIRPLSTATDGVIASNQIYINTDGAASSTRYAIDLASGNTGYAIVGNNVDTSDSANNQVCLRTNASATGGLIGGNVLVAASNSLADNAGSTLGTNIST